MPRQRKWHGMNWIRRDKRLAIHIRDRFECVWCEKDLRDAEPGECTLDHFKPHVEGGTNGEDNLVTACQRCNKSRKARSAPDFLYDLSISMGMTEIGSIAFVTRRLSYARAQMQKPINRKLAKALIDGKELTLDMAS